MTTLRSEYLAGMSATIAEAECGFRDLAPGRITTAMGLLNMCMYRIPDMPTALLEIIHSYMDFIDESALVEVLSKCEYQHRPWIRSLIIMAIGTDNSELFSILLEQTEVWIIYPSEVPRQMGIFEKFRKMPDYMDESREFIQTVTNLLCYLGRAGRDSEWLTEYFRIHSSVIFGINYMVMGSCPVDVIQYNMEIAGFALRDPKKWIELAMQGGQNPEILAFLRSPRRFFRH
jgi:hypothetical protein